MPGEELSMPLSEYSDLLCGKLTEDQLHERMVAIGKCIDAAKAEAEAAFERSPEKVRFDELYEPYKWRGGAWQQDEAVMAAYHAKRASEESAYARTARLREDYGRVYCAWSDRRRTCSRCWDVVRTAGCGWGCACEVPAPPPLPDQVPQALPSPPPPPKPPSPEPTETAEEQSERLLQRLREAQEAARVARAVQAAPSQPLAPASQPETVPPAEPKALPSARATYYRVVLLLCGKLTEDQLHERMVAIGKCIDAAKAEAEAAFERSPENYTYQGKWIM